ncbi:hypothetical protein LCGC14_1710120 [marine sediment metagenome]|uniref:Uncharacterized protein n=1 Tax=marine sediment metagenome TaxID=412755 RepID=A0A0F9HG36_9ZZZZ
MTTKWSVNKAIESLQNLTNPFEQAGAQNLNEKPKLSEIISRLPSNGETEPQQEIIS